MHTKQEERAEASELYSNAANELAVRQVLNREIKYLEITEIIEDCMKAHKNIENPTLEQILETEAATYERINSRR